MKNNAGRWLRTGIIGIVLLVLVIWYSVGAERGEETVKLGQPVLDGPENSSVSQFLENGFSDGEGQNRERDITAEKDSEGYGLQQAGTGDTGPDQTGAGAVGSDQIGTGTDQIGVADAWAGKIGEADKTAEAEKAGRIFIHVCGEVVSPGVYELSEGSRLYQAVEAAGGLTEEADGDFLNMALTLADGMQLRIPDRREAEELRRAGSESAGGQPQDGSQAAAYGGLIRGGGQEQSGSQSGNSTQGGSRMQSESAGWEQDGRVNLNTATKEQLMTLSGIGEARAEAILAYRRESGGFKTIEDIMKVSGIKEAAFQKIKDDITV